MKKLIIIPAYNEEECIYNTVNELIKKADGFDYVIINDCSTDRTKEICEINGFNVVNLPINLGIGGAVQTGYKYAYKKGYDCAVQVDGDGQHDVSYLKYMSACMEEENLDMIIGSRFINKEGFQSSFGRRIGIKFFTLLIRVLTGEKITDPTSGLRMVGKRTLEIFAEDYPKDYPEPESTVVVIRKKLKVKEIPVIMRERTGGKSSISLKKSIYYMIKVPLAIVMECMRRRSKNVDSKN